jgi:hypothetical protein
VSKVNGKKLKTIGGFMMPVAGKEVVPSNRGLPVDSAVRIRQALDDGYAFPCAMCLKLWRQLDQGHDQCEASRARVPCGLIEAFRAYEGPLANLYRHCFRCGKVCDPDEGDKVLEMNGSPDRRVGVCKKHVPALTRILGQMGAVQCSP